MLVRSLARRRGVFARSAKPFSWLAWGMMLAAWAAPGAALAAEPSPAPAPERPAAAARVDEAVQAQLDRKLPEVKFDGNGVSDVMDFLRDVTGANIYVNWRALEAAGISKDAPISVRLVNVKFSKLLDTLVKDLDPDGKAALGWSVEEGVVTLTTHAAAGTVTRVYDVHDLLAARGRVPVPIVPELAPPSRADVLMKLITGSVAPSTWIENGGQVGTLKELSGQLIVNTTEVNHKAIANLLEQLRQLMK